MITATLDLADGTRVVVPDSLDLITPYVLREQGDWFEDEIRFVRRVLERGESAIDIGANYGVYTAAMANAVGPAGRVWAFEPASSTAALLEKTIEVNRFAQVVLDRTALSRAAGSARLSIHPHAEANALIAEGEAAAASETVPVTTLDEAMEANGWEAIDFVKIDAEGEEANIVAGGRGFFGRCSPLVQFEIKAGSELHLDLIGTFADIGYTSYRFVRGLGALAPFGDAPDAYVLNALACKPDRADALAARGLLIRAERGATQREGWFASAWQRLRRNRARGWRDTLEQLPYGRKLSAVWARGASHEVDEAIVLYGVSRDPAQSPARRYAALEAALARMRSLCETDPGRLRLATLARIAADYGARAVAVDALSKLYQNIAASNEVDFSEPFLAPAARFDAIDPGGSLAQWIVAAVLEPLEELAAFSSFYTGASARPRLECLRDTGFASPGMLQRLALVERRFGGRAR